MRWLIGVTVAAGALACTEDPVLQPPIGGTAGDGGTAGMGGGGGMGGSGNAGNMGGSGGSGEAGHLDYVVCDDPPASYPAGPYGNELGDTLTPLAMQGWINTDGSDLATTAPFAAFSSDDIRQSGSPHVLLHLAATW